MADLERTVLDFYQISTLNPGQWPAEKDNDSDANRRKSRYQALERAVSTRSSIVPGSENSGSGVGNLVQRDEPDPLGTTDSVVRTLKHLGVPLQDDLRLRNRFLLSSTTFSPALFLSQMHATADTQSLINGLEVLSKSIDQKSASLKVLVESNFERFVRAKATIDNVYKEMKYRGADPTPTRARGHSRHASRASFRSGSGPQPLNSPHSPATDPRRKNALIKESEFGVLGIKAPLLDVSAKAEDVWGPALGGREKEEHLKTVASCLDQYKEYVETSAAISDSIKRKDHETLVEEYTKARKFADEAKRLAEEVRSSQPTDDQLYRILLAARMWHDVEEQIQVLKRDIWRRLISPYNMAKADNAGQHDTDQHMELISLLLELGVEDNPIWVWLLSRYDYLKSKIQSTAERAKVEIEILRRRLANAEKPSPQTIASHMRTLGRQAIETTSKTFDSADVVELWEMNVSFLTNLLSSQGILGEVLEFWQTVQGFIDGKTQRTLPVGYNGESQDHHRLSQQGTTDLQKGTVELISMLRENVLMFFAGPPPEDLSLLLSPMPPHSPGTPGAASISSSLSPRDPRFNLDPSNPPPPSPKRGEAWEKFAFWPPWSNSLSGVHFLSKMLVLVGSGASDMASVSPVGRGDTAELERIKTLVGVARERCVTALCAAWNRDAENIKYVEDWNRSPDSRDVTKMPASFAAFEGALLSGMQKILYISDAMSKPGAGDIVLPPPTKLLQMVRSQYVTTLYKALSGMVENAERFPKKTDDEWTVDADGYVLLYNPANTQLSASAVGGGTIDAGDRNIRMLLTLSNLQALRSNVVPSLNTQFENAFSVKLTDETKTIRDVLGQIDARLFQSYTRPSIDSLKRVIRAGVSSPDWLPPPGSKPREVRPYVYEALLGLVLVHTQVSTTAASLTTEVLSYLLEQVSRELLDAFKTRPRYNLEALMQATLDVEFVAQTLSHYTTDRASELQSAIYQELDGRTDNDARARLQAELPEMRAVLKRLREASKSEFACFRKPKKSATGRGASVSGSGPGPGPLERRDTGGSVGSI
ncbi:exocyst complex component Sec5-domain-containing protein [Chaetomium strumarium]|uniref:Exocyst complex component SEC5 n=1 Tax=Chaetomium strumarium TaxID=1170767 RepID=A0AAJ0GVW9_9PEZI|nr:exocyst complex component Sec5-domain-containing protein [Chaetomium strumarium]